MADKRSKKIKFALSLKNNEEVRTKRDLKKYFDMAEIIGYLFDGKLLQWMRDHDYPTASCLAVKEILRDYNKKRIAVRNLSLGDEKISLGKLLSSSVKFLKSTNRKLKILKALNR